MDYLIEVITTQNITSRYFTKDITNIEKYVQLVMVAEKCPRRSIIKIIISQVENDTCVDCNAEITIHNAVFGSSGKMCINCLKKRGVK